MFILPVNPIRSFFFVLKCKTSFFKNSIELDENAREANDSLYCLPCHFKLGLPVCAACRRIIDDRVVSALGKQ